MRFVLITIFFSLLSIPAKTQNDPVPYSFFVAGHTYGAPGVDNIGFHPPFKAKFSYIQSRPEIEFGVLTGDIVSSNPTAVDWDEIDADIDTLGLPTYFAVGNHDMENRPLFESRYGNTYYSFVHQNDLFIVLDPNIDEWNISGAQLQFLQDVVQNRASAADNIYVFFHQILWKEADNPFNYIHWNSSVGRGESVNFWSEVEPIFRSLSNDVIMFAGDLGAPWTTDVTYDSYDNITLIATGMGDPDGENFVVVNVEANKSVNYDLICLSSADMNCLGKLTDYLRVTEVPIANDTIDIESPSVSLYPNPAINQVTISQNLIGKATIQLFNTIGRLVLEERLEKEDHNTIDIDQFSSGIYFARVFNSKHDSTTKLVIE